MADLIIVNLNKSFFMSKNLMQDQKKESSNKHSKPMTKAEIFQKIIADQKFLEEARRKGISYQELREKYGYSFATVKNLRS